MIEEVLLGVISMSFAALPPSEDGDERIVCGIVGDTELGERPPVTDPTTVLVAVSGDVADDEYCGLPPVVVLLLGDLAAAGARAAEIGDDCLDSSHLAILR